MMRLQERYPFYLVNFFAIMIGVLIMIVPCFWLYANMTVTPMAWLVALEAGLFFIGLGILPFIQRWISWRFGFLDLEAQIEGLEQQRKEEFYPIASRLLVVTRSIMAIREEIGSDPTRSLRTVVQVNHELGRLKVGSDGADLIAHRYGVALGVVDYQKEIQTRFRQRILKQMKPNNLEQT